MHQIYLLTLGKRNIILTSVSKEGKENAHYFLRKKRRKKKKKRIRAIVLEAKAGSILHGGAGCFFSKKNKLLI